MLRISGLVLLLCGLAAPSARAADAQFKIIVTNGGVDAEGNGSFEVRPAGKHSADVIASEHSGGTVRVAAGTYDVKVIYQDGNAEKTISLDGLALSGTVQKIVEVGLPVAALRLVITNGGADVERNGSFEVRPAGKHSADAVASEHSGGTVRVAVGTYDVDVHFQSGNAEKTIRLDGLALSGTVEKTVEIDAPVADVTWHITNQGKDVGDDGVYRIRPGGRHDSEPIALASSGQPSRVLAADYDVEIVFSKGMLHKTIWLDHQKLTGKVERTTELGLNPASATVTATLDGKDVGDNARIGFTPLGQHDEIGAVQSGETAVVDAGHYELTATMPGAEGALNDASIQAETHLVIAMKTLRTVELKPNGPPPKECIIEIYGVNFDFDKAILRPDSEPVLQTVLRLFTSGPSFSGEVSGHTDNIGKPDYNMKLSQARAEAVKAWLVAHGVAAARVTSRGYGDTRPLLANDTDANRFKNRRVELRRANCQ
jgi:outer membrane protein OmpA-like peptidoglycan-associated protein